MGMVFACIHWDKFLRNGLTFCIVVDHKALLWLVTRKTKTANDNLSHIYSYFDTFQPNTGSDDTPELLIEEEDEPDALEDSKRINNSFRKFHTFINSVEMTDRTNNQPRRHHAINISQFNSHTKSLKQLRYTQMLKEAQSSFKPSTKSALKKTALMTILSMNSSPHTGTLRGNASLILATGECLK
jgi:hypothetical protein